MSIASEPRASTAHEYIPPPRSKRGEWTWELVTMFPQQGEWTEVEYLAREFDGLVEYSDGFMEFLPVPTWLHQILVDFLHSRLKEFVQARSLGRTAFAPLRVRIAPRQYREPDVLFVRRERIRDLGLPADGADLVMEVVSESQEDRDRDLIVKRKEYALAGIPEYWIVDPKTQTITVLVLSGTEYVVRGEYKPGMTATSHLLTGFEIDVTNCFDSAKAQEP